MLKVAYELLKDFGVLGLNVVQFGVILFGGWKLFTNHLKHLKDDIETSIRETKCIKRAVNKLNNRVSKIEGKLEK